jgi:hypothetical protein
MPYMIHSLFDQVAIGDGDFEFLRLLYQFKFSHLIGGKENQDYARV